MRNTSKPIEDEHDSVKEVNCPKVERLFEEYVVKTCIYYRQRFGPDVLQPSKFDNIFNREMKIDQVDSYEAWMRCKLYYLKHCAVNPLGRLHDYITPKKWRSNDITTARV